MISKKLIDVLNKITQRMNKTNVQWALVGTTNHLLQGMDVRPKDIDIIISHSDLEKIKKAFSDFDFQIGEFPNKEAQKMSFKIDDFDIEICADYPHGKYHKKRCEKESSKLLDLGKLNIPVFTLESEIACYQLAGRFEKAEKINQFIKEASKTK